MERQKEVLKLVVGLKRVNANLEKVMHDDILEHGLNVNEFAILELLFHKGEQQIQTIKEKILVANSSTSYLLNKLIEKKLCHRRLDENDKRIAYISLTESGKTLMESVFPKHASVLENTAKNLTDKEIATLRKLLKKMSGLI